MRVQTTENIGARIAELRGEMGQQDLARAVGLDPTVLSKIEAGKRPLRIGELVTIARELGVDAAVLLNEERAAFALRGEASAPIHEAVQHCERIMDAYLTLSALTGDR
jgi:transcriptional regulator with XRE-family HTH domain